MLAGVIIEAIEIAEELEKVRGYWDDKGLDMHIAVKADGRLAVSTKHWVRVHYIKTYKTPEELWKILSKVATAIGRSLVRSKYGPYVYIPKLSIEHTQHIFDMFKKDLGHNIDRVYEFSWDIDDAVIVEVAPEPLPTDLTSEIPK